MTIENLVQRVHHELSVLNYRGKGWVRPREGAHGLMYDAVIVGGGQSGLGAAFGLQLEGVHNLIIFDRNDIGHEGPWATYARMPCLRTPKNLTSIDAGVASLTFRSWYEVQFGAASWDTLQKIPREMWSAYLMWYRSTLALPVANGVAVQMIEPLAKGGFAVHVEGYRESVVEARKVILATGMEGGGEWRVPPELVAKLPPHAYSHCSRDIDFSRFRNKRVGVVGAGAAAFDNAHYFLAAGAKSVDVFVRRKHVPRINPIRFMEEIRLPARHALLDDAAKYRIAADFLAHGQPPTNDTFALASTWPGFGLHVDAPLLDVDHDGEVIHVSTPRRAFQLDFLLLCTGFVSDPSLRPELSHLAEDICRWRDRYTPPEDIRNPLIDEHPYLGPGFQFIGRNTRSAVKLAGLYAFNHSALVSHGPTAAALSGLRFALPRLTSAIAADLFADDSEHYLDALECYDVEEFTSGRDQN